MSASKNPDSSFTKERNNKTPTLKLSLKGQPKSLPNLFESMNINEEGKKPKPYSQKSAVVRSRVKSFEGKKVALKPVLTRIDGLKLTIQAKDSTPLSSLRISNTNEELKKSEKALASNNKSRRRQLYQDLKETKEKALEAKMGSDYGPPLSSLKISNTNEDLKKYKKAISSNNECRRQLYQGLKETKENVLASRVGCFSRNALEAKMGLDYGPPMSSLKISNTEEVWGKMKKIPERSNGNPTLKLSLKGHQSLPSLFESMNLQDGKTKPYSQNKVVAR